MFETAELGRLVSKEDYDSQIPALRTTLLALQRDQSQAKLSVVILVHGVDGAGKGDVINLLNEWMDTRSLRTVAFDEPVEEERHRPPYWRYWMALPPRGQAGIHVGAWYIDPIDQRFRGKMSDAELDAALARINAFEKSLTEDGTVVVKLWLHLSKKEQRRRFNKLEKNPDTRWRVTKKDWKHAKRYDEFRSVCEHVLRETSTGDAPWFVVEATDPRYRNVTVAQHLIDSIRRRLDAPKDQSPAEPMAPMDNPHTILDTLDLSNKVPKEDYRGKLERLQSRLNELSLRAWSKEVGATLVFEGSDAAGKGGVIRRLTPALDARQFRVIQVAAPTDEEKAHHYLWRFWRHLPRLGRFTIYDRSWYGRVLVERVEGFATKQAWMRAYKEINDFEKHLIEHGIVLVKFWLQISPEEQLRRFEARERTPWKQYKITAEDYRNREKTHQYEAAANEMIERTSTEYAPWTLVEAEDKPYARIKALQTVCDRLEGAM
jgi:polyphosphate:AMP phosphotransferase